METVELTDIYNTSLGVMAVMSLEEGKMAKAGDLVTYKGSQYVIKRFLATGYYDEKIAVAVEKL